jgi:hypothetical protein
LSRAGYSLDFKIIDACCSWRSYKLMQTLALRFELAMASICRKKGVLVY